MHRLGNRYTVNINWLLSVKGDLHYSVSCIVKVNIKPVS